MENVLNWFRANPDVVGFLTASIIFLFTLILVSRKAIGFFMTLLLLIFALGVGLLIANYPFIRLYLQCPVVSEKTQATLSEEMNESLCLAIPEGDEHWICPNCQHKNNCCFTCCQGCGWGK